MVVLFLVLAGVACALSDKTDTTSTDNLVDTSGWVAYVGSGIQAAVPANTWRGIPLNVAQGVEELEALKAEDPTVANVYEFLLRHYVPNSNTRLVLMKTDGTAWVVISESSLGETGFANRVLAIKTSQRANSTNPFAEERIDLPIGRAERWQITYSPQGSQVVNRQWHYAIQREDTVLHVIFDAQEPDFADYQALFRTIAETLLAL